MLPSSPSATREQIPWKHRARAQFDPAVLVRGDAYFRQHRVRLERATPREIRALVMGTEVWRCSVQDTGARLHLDCNCPHFRGGHACKHLWAAILAADKALDLIGNVEKPPTISVKPSPKTPPAPSWRTLLFPAASAEQGQAEARPAGRWDGAPGHFLLRYELEILPAAWQLTAVRQNVLKSGELGRQAVAAPVSILNEPDLPEAHRAILETLLLVRMTEFPSVSGRYGVPSTFEDCPLPASRLAQLLPLLADMGRCRVHQGKAVLANPLHRGEPFEGAVEFAVDPGSLEPRRKELVYLPQLRLGERVLPLAEVQALLAGAPAMCLVHGALHRLPEVRPEWLRGIQRAGFRVPVPKTELRDLLQTPDGSRLPLPEALGPRPLSAGPPRPCLELEIIKSEAVSGRLWLAYGDLEIACDDPRPAIFDVEAWTRLDRQPEVERRCLRRLEQLGLPARAAAFPLPAGSLWDLTLRLEPLAEEGWTLRTRDRQPLARGQLGAVRMTAGQDWFELDGGVSFGEAIVPLPAVVRAFLRGERTLQLDAGGLGLLPEDWLQRHATALGLGMSPADLDTPSTSKTPLRFHPAQLFLVDELLEAADGLAPHGLAMDRASADFRKKLKEFRGVSTPSVPASFCGTLRPYQQETLGWLDFLGAFGLGGILADDMGLGKTIQALAWMALEKERRTPETPARPSLRPSLVVAPTSLLATWRDEATRFCPSLRVCTYAGPDRQALAAGFGEQDLVLVTYGLLRRDLETLRRVRWQCLILDESQAVKNPDSQTAKAARVLQAERRLCMTGTPLENRLEEVWSQMQCCAPGLLGPRGTFEARFVRPMGQPDSEEAAQARALLTRLLRPFILRRTKDAVAPELPEKQEAILRCEMPAAQAKLYARLRDHYRGELLAAVETQGLDKSRFAVLEGLLRLRQAACHPGLLGDERAASGKLETLIRVLGEVVAEGHKALVFSQFTAFLDRIRHRLEAEGISHLHLDGSTPAQARADRVAAFQDPAGPPVFCISLKAGGVGLTLTAADYVFLMDPWWNPAVESQAMDRAHRIGQTKKVFAYRLVSEGTIDEKVLALQAKKRDLAAILDEGATSVLSSLSREDLEALLG